MSEKILIRYGEIALKGKNRRFFEEILLQNLRAAVRGRPVQISRLYGRFLATCPEQELVEVMTRLGRVFGVASLSAVKTASLGLPAIQDAAAALARALPARGAPATFKVETRRPNKSFPLTSPEINSLVGAYILEACPQLKVDVHNPSLKLSIEIGQKEAFLYHDQLPGPGGLPVGVTGRGLLLLSGGIDSPVAGWLAMKRGLAVEAVHFHSFPFTSPRSREKAVDLCRILARYGGEVTMHLVSVTAIQQAIRAHCPEELGIIILRRMMLRAAELIARRRQLQALVTGESLGQVASQTLESMTVISDAADLLILRPLLGMDKHEIIDRAQAIGTYAVSIRPFEDCCTLFVPRHPATRPALEQVEKAEAALDTGALLAEALSGVETELFRD